MFDKELEVAKLETEIIELRKSNLTLQTKLIKAKAKVDELAAATVEAAHNAVVDLGGIGDVTPPSRDQRKARELVCLWHLTDWQGGKKTPSYDSGVMVKRVDEFLVKAHKLVQDYRTSRPVKHCVIVFGGDMVEGLFNFPSQAYEVDQTLFAQYVNVSKTITEAVQFALGVFEKVTVVSEWGNHGRIGARGQIPRADNIDRMCYELARQLLAGEKRLTWEDSPNDWQKIEIGNYRAIAIHGDEVGRNGFASSATIVQHIARWQSGSLDYDFRDAYIGHYHTHSSWSLPNGFGQVYQTGSTESDNRYAQVGLASMAVPSQRMHLIDPVKGRVIAEHKIWLDGQ
jgi:hypothetical protein